jgi:hypothetical protein
MEGLPSRPTGNTIKAVRCSDLSPAQNRFIRCRVQPMFALCIILSAVLVGCFTGRGRVVPSPLGYTEQSASILKIAPVGTPRELAVQSLSAAGIEGTYSRGGNSIYYCDLWQRENGDRWHLDVAILFDDDGQVKATRPAQSEIQTLAE